MSMWSKAAATKRSRDSATTSSDSQSPDVIVIPMKISVDTKNKLKDAVAIFIPFSIAETAMYVVKTICFLSNVAIEIASNQDCFRFWYFYAGCVIKDGRVTYSGPTMISIRSGKHDKSSAATHVADFNTLVRLDTFKNVACTNAGVLKPIVIITVDGGPDENPRYPKTLCAAYKLFTEHDVDALFIASHAPGHSAYNAVERRMAPLSHDLFGLILPYDCFGSHLDTNGKTIDPELEKLCQSSSTQVLNGVGIMYNSHTPIPFVNNEAGVIAAAIGSGSGVFGSLFQSLALNSLEPCHNYPSLPFDLNCPSLAGKIHKRMCFCGKYFPSLANMKGHKVVHENNSFIDQDNEEESIEDFNKKHNSTDVSTTDVIMIRNLFDWLQSDFQY
ncbi:hypothetical protein HELRODRAFT_174271 [Helobdella robusta]|uniref:C2H2-type domain-containing protein n=1 Tax=Helobdella robusta TaxID=6412 RepID=T1F7X2_HELRO|nr:hypothetical protein HELRODRAFT_174271 [Helobdella robusta]ESO02842.1 hypothetical protein HELRODRAFT_174271 [Helobdella robusta]